MPTLAPLPRCALLLVLTGCAAPPDDPTAATDAVATSQPTPETTATDPPGSTSPETADAAADSTSSTTTDADTTPDSAASTTTDADTTLAPTTAASDSGSSATTDADTTVASTTGAAEPGAAELGFGCTEGQPRVRLRLLLGEPACDAGWPGVSLRVDLWSVSPLTPGTYPLGPGLGLALLIDGGAPDPSVVGSVTIDGVDADAVHGSYVLEFSDHGELAGAFAGPVCGEPVRCE